MQRYSRNAYNFLHKRYNVLLDFILPHTCLNCKQIVTSYGLCPECFNDITPIVDPKCHRCGLPLARGANHTWPCGLCTKPKRYTARSAVVYNNGSKDLILRFKHGDGRDLAPFIAERILRSIADILSDVHVILPVPLHQKRLLKRHYNQACLLALYMAKKSGVSLRINDLIRIKNTAAQESSSHAYRNRNVKNDFIVKKDHGVRGKGVLLVDDVFTSGATVDACAKVLLQAGAGHVFVATYARVLPKEMPRA